MPLMKTTLTVGRDLPIGAILYSQYLQPIADSLFCNGPGTGQYSADFGYTPLPKANWSGSPFANKVYETGVPGIGVTFTSGTYEFPLAQAFNVSSLSSTIRLEGRHRTDIKLIKIGPIAPGIIKAINLPRALSRVQDDIKIFDTQMLNLVGDIAVVSQTCETPDVTVDMGVNSIEPLVAGTATETAVKDFSIVMRNCPIFYGYLTEASWSPAVGNLIYRENSNNLKISFTPKNGTLDTGAYIANLDPIQPNGAVAASGIGITLYASGSRYRFDNHLINLLTPTIGSTAEITIPLKAVYAYDTSKPRSLIKPGSGYASIEFTIEYN